LTLYRNNAIILPDNVNHEFTIEYVELPNGRSPAREFVDSLDEQGGRPHRRFY
jgi:hypothetical protein